MQLPHSTISLTRGGRGWTLEKIRRMSTGSWQGTSPRSSISYGDGRVLWSTLPTGSAGDRSRAEDMAQEALLRAFRGLKGWRRDAAFSTWIFAIASNFYRSEVRRIPEGTLALDSIEGLAALNAEFIEAKDEDRDRAVRRAVSALPGKYKEVLVLFYFHEMDIAATSRSLGLPEGTVKARLSRGRKILRSKLPQFLGELSLEEAQ